MVGLGDLSSGAQITIGVCVGVLSTSVQSLGLTLQRKSHLLEDDRPPHIKKRPPHRRRMWQIGILLFIVSNILGSSIQITTLPLVILSPLQASGLVFNSICATLILSEPFTRYSLIGTILVCIGAALIAAFGAMKEPAHSLDELLDLLAKKTFLSWMACTALLVFGILGATKASSILRPRLKHTAKMRMVRGVAYGCVSGILSAHCLLLAKSAVELLVRTIVDRHNQFNRWQSWMILLGLAALALTQLYYLHRGLKLCSTSVLYPLVFCVYNIIAILDGLLYYRQASRLTLLHGCLIALGTAILLTGVLALSWRLNQEQTGPSAGAAGALSPGIGFIDTDSSDPSTDTEGESSEIDTNQQLLSPSSPSARSKFLKRRRALSEVEEIWGELQDEGGLPRDEEEAGSDVDEGTSLLRKGPGGRRYTRKGSYIGRGGSGRSSRKERILQGAIGGWWKLKWWKEGKEGNPGCRRGQSDDGDDTQDGGGGGGD
ncbi:unnamed protein product [Tuber melanosporum]|uniref:(Perigord truffle) hypothetical protein n=1 Tax=Tuber melanosporum (strain Mel28) TaxID=656061 RepID=D5GQ44_TUBMM|nr:uncharacterized protein GSTUM_00012193001 [Tuber melanosporum]CAZ86637.1 unnamed protein product [Tuber melanosporum]